MTPAQRSPTSILRLLVACAAAAAACNGCTPSSSRSPSVLGPGADRLIRAYPDLDTGRFLVLADFEDSAQQTLFRVTPGPRPAKITTRKSRQTGAGALQFTLSDTRDRLAADNLRADGWHLPANWTEHQLLLMSIHAERAQTGFVFEARSGIRHDRQYQTDPMPLEPGWNLIRIDLAQLANVVDLRDIRQLRWGCLDLTQPTDFHLDDLILANNRQALVPTSEQTTTGLYVERRGKRLHVGVARRFELVFADGHITQWLDMGYSQGPPVQLASTHGLGPFQLAFDGQTWRPKHPQTEAIQTTTKLIETDPKRVVIEATWAPAHSQPTQRCVYTITPGGQVYIQWHDRQTASQMDTGFGAYLLSTTGVMTTLHGPDKQVAAKPISLTLHARTQPGQADLLTVMHEYDQAPSQMPVSHLGSDTVGSIACGGPGAGNDGPWAMMWVVWPPDLDSLVEAGPVAADYAYPAELAIDIGALRRDEPGDFNNDGFNEAQGHYCVAVSGGVARLRIDGRDQLRFYPTLRIEGAGEPCWAYADGQLVDRAWRDPDGALMVRIDRIVSDVVTVEVITSTGSASAQPE